jgi:Na+-driven multidrug efflux pump
MVLGFIMLGLNILCNLIFIPDNLLGIKMLGLGPLGAAISLTFSSFVGTFLFRYYAFKTSKSKPNYVIFSHFAIALFTFGGLYLLYQWMEISLYSIPVFFAIGSLLYLLQMWLFKQFTKDDFKYYLNMLSPKLMKNYVKDELKS